MGEIILEIMSEEYREEFHEEYSDCVLNSLKQCADVQYLAGPGHSATAASESPASLSAGYSANTYHFGLITHSVLAARAPSVAPT